MKDQIMLALDMLVTPGLFARAICAEFGPKYLKRLCYM